MFFLRSTFLLGTLLLVAFTSLAQTGTLTGIVTDGTNGEPVPFANIVASNGNGAATDFDGKYTLTLPAGEQVVRFSSVGFSDTTYTVSITAGETTTLDIKAGQQAVRLNITTVVGGKFKKELGEEIVTVEVLNKGIIENSNAFNMDEAMEKVPGVTIVDGQANIRGGSGWSYGAGSRVLVLVDDIPLLTADAADVKWSFIPTENVEQVEVVKGAASALYGSSALNGVINVITAWPTNEPYTKINIYGGITENPSDHELVWWDSYGFKNFFQNQPMFGGGNFVHRHRVKTVDLVVSGSYNGKRSHLQGGSNQEMRMSFKNRWRPKNVRGLSMGVNVNAYHSRGSTFFLWDGADSLSYLPLPGSVSDYKTLRLTIDPHITYFDKHDNRYKLNLRYFNALNTNNTGQGSLPQLFYAEFQFQRRFMLGKSKNIGFNVVAGVATTYSDVRPPGGADPSESLVGAHTGNNYAVYAQVETKLFRKLSLGAGVRYEYFRIDEFKSDALPVFRFGLNYQAAEATFIRASIGQGYRFPTIAEKFVSTTVGGAIGIYPNPGLEPEKGWSTEIGIKQGVKLGKWLGYIDLAGFINQYDNMMEFTFGQFGTGDDPLFGLGFASQNIGNTRIYGAELTMIGQGKIADKFPLTILAGYTYILPTSLNWNDTLELYNSQGDKIETFIPTATSNGSFTYAGSSSSSKNILKYRNQHTVKLDAQIDIKKFLVGVSVQYTSFMENIDYLFVSDFIIGAEGSLVETTAFSGLKKFREENRRGNTQLDVRFGYNITDKIRVMFIGKNMLNQIQMIRPAYLSQPRNYTIQASFEF